MIDITKPVQMKNGTPVKLVCTDLCGGPSLLGTYIRDGEKFYSTWYGDGRWRDHVETMKDLQNAPEVRKMYANIYKDGDRLPLHASRDDAELCAGVDAIRIAAPVEVKILPG